MNGRVDLDALESFYSRIDFDRSPQIVAAVRELRAARTVVATLRIYDDGPMELPAPLAAVLAAYDQAMTS